MRFVTLFLCLGLLCGGCSIFSSLPSKLLGKKQAQIDKIDKKVDTNQDKQLEASKSYVWGVQYSLGLSPNKNSDKYVGLAYDLAQKSLQITGNPSVESANVFKQIVEKAASTNKIENLESERLLASRDLAIAELQAQYNRLQADKSAAEDRYKEVAKENSKYGDIFVRARRYFMIVVWGLGIMFVLRIVSAVLPPPYNLLGAAPDAILGGMFRVGSKILTHAPAAAAVVGKEAHEISEKTLTSVVKALQLAKESDNSGLIAEVLAPHLNEHGDDQTRSKINSIKMDLKNKGII